MAKDSKKLRDARWQDLTPEEQARIQKEHPRDKWEKYGWSLYERADGSTYWSPWDAVFLWPSR